MHKAQLDIPELALCLHKEAVIWEAIVNDKIPVLEFLREQKLFDPRAPVGGGGCWHEPVVWAAWNSSSTCLDWMMVGWSVDDVCRLAVNYHNVLTCYSCQRSEGQFPTGVLAKVCAAFLRASDAPETSRLHRLLQREALRVRCQTLFRCTLGGQWWFLAFDSLMESCMKPQSPSDRSMPDSGFLTASLGAAPSAAHIKSLVAQDDRWRHVVARYFRWGRTHLLQELIDRWGLWSKQQHLDLLFISPLCLDELVEVGWLFKQPAPAAAKAAHVIVLLSSSSKWAPQLLELALNHIEPSQLQAVEHVVYEHFSGKPAWPNPSILAALRAARVFPAAIERDVRSRLQRGLSVDEWRRWQWPDIAEMLADIGPTGLGSLSNGAREVVWDLFLLPVGWSATAIDLQGFNPPRSLPWFEPRATFLVRRGFCWSSYVVANRCLNTKDREDYIRLDCSDPVDMACNLWHKSKRFTEWLLSVVLRLVPCGTRRTRLDDVPSKARPLLANAYVIRSNEIRDAIAPSLSHVADLASLVGQYLE